MPPASTSWESQDPGGIHDAYDMWPEAAAESYGDAADHIHTEDITHVVFAGMGGSGALGDFVGALMSGLDMHVSVVKGYNLPKTADAKTLVVCSSVSGNTAETLTVLEKAAASCRTLSFSSGGAMEEYCRRNALPHHRVEAMHSPRASFVSFLYSMLAALGGLTGASDADVAESIRVMRRTRDAITADGAENPARKLAGWLTGMPVVYYPWGFEAAATRFKNSLQENAKTHAVIEDVLEASHNGIVAWESATPARPVLIQGPDDNPRTKERWRVFEEYFDARAIPYKAVRAVDGHILTKLVNLVYMLDYTTIYLAGIRGVDPTPVYSIDFVKERTGHA